MFMNINGTFVVDDVLYPKIKLNCFELPTLKKNAVPYRTSFI